MSSPSQNEHRPWIDGIYIIVAATLIGPPIGGFFLGIAHLLLTFFYSLWELVSTGGVVTPANGKIATIFWMPFMYAFFSYTLGGVPALVSGILSAIYAARYKCLPLKIVFLFVFIACALFAVFLFAGSKWSISLFGLLMFGTFFLTGWAAAYCVMRLFVRYLTIDQTQELVQ